MNKRGFTLVELVFVSAMAVLILGALVALYTTNHQFYNMASIFTELRGYTKNFKNQVSKDIEEAVTVVSNHDSYTTGAHELVLTCYSLYTTAAGEEVFDTSHYDYIAYHISGTKVQRIVDADDTVTNKIRVDSSRDLIEQVYSLSFYYYDHNETQLTSDYTTTSRIGMSLEVRKTWAGKERKETMIASARLRNKR